MLSHPATNKSVEGLAIIDDQSGMTFIDPIVAQKIELPQSVMRPSKQGLLTMEGEMKSKPCHVITGLVMTPMDGQPSIALPSSVMQNKIPDAWDQIPSRKDVENTHGFAKFAPYFPEKDRSKNYWPTIILIGRDCMAAQKQDQFYSDDNRDQIVVKTPLGYALVGSPDPNAPRNAIPS